QKDNLSRAVLFPANQAPQRDFRDRFPGVLFQNKNSVTLKQPRQSLVMQKFVRKSFARFRFLVGRVGKDDLELVPGRGRILKKAKSLLLPDPPGQSRFGEIFFNRRDRLSIFFNEKSEGSTAAERFDPKGAGAGKEVENARADHDLAETGEHRRFHAIHCWAHAILRRNEMNAAGTTGDHSHGERDGLGAGGDAVTPGLAGGVDSSVSFGAPFFFFDLSAFPPPQKLFTKSFRSRPTTFSSRFVLGRSSVPVSSKSTAE